jgi:hypothetical protein
MLASAVTDKFGHKQAHTVPNCPRRLLALVQFRPLDETLLIATVTIRPVASAVHVCEHPKLDAANLGFHNKIVSGRICAIWRRS